MPERRRRPRVTLCAAITFDGKLDARRPISPVLLTALAPTDGDRLVADTAVTADVRVVASTARARPADAVRALARDPSVRRILCLGGSRLFRALLDAGLADDLCLLVRARVDGRRAAPTLSGAPAAPWFPRSIPCRLRRVETFGGECLLRYAVVGGVACGRA